MTASQKDLAGDLLRVDESELKAFELEIKDRESARAMYKEDDIMQKIFGLAFLVGYSFMCWYMLNILSGEGNESELFKTMVTMIFTATSTKLSTIIDFFFGGRSRRSTFVLDYRRTVQDHAQSRTGSHLQRARDRVVYSVG